MRSDTCVRYRSHTKDSRQYEHRQHICCAVCRALSHAERALSIVFVFWNHAASCRRFGDTTNDDDRPADKST